jgi:hypothetical protein
MVAFSSPVQSYSSSSFSFTLQQTATKSKFQMQFPASCTTTRVLPHTYKFLKKNIPSILKCECYNDDSLPFYKEVKHTEMAHLFEHILLDQLCQEKSAEVDAEYSGQTEWDWNIHPVGSFKVIVGCTKCEEKYLAIALNKTIRLMELLISKKSNSNKELLQA